jgi:hypothetical protein
MFFRYVVTTKTSDGREIEHARFWCSDSAWEFARWFDAVRNPEIHKSIHVYYPFWSKITIK